MGYQTAQSANTAINTQVTIMSTSTTCKNKHALMPQQRLHFYQNGHMATEVANQVNRQVLWANDVALAQLDKSQPAKMLRVDLANSVLGLASESMAYSPYGYLATEKMKALLQFNGQWCDPFTEGYHLGQGHRVYSPRRMRFCSDDESSPMEEGGLHPSAYCEGDPINRLDPTGKSFIPRLKAILEGAQRAFMRTGAGVVQFNTHGIHGFTRTASNTPRKGLNTPASNSTVKATNSLQPLASQKQLPIYTTTSSPTTSNSATANIFLPNTGSLSETKNPLNLGSIPSHQDTKTQLNRIIGYSSKRDDSIFGSIFGVIFGGTLLGVVTWLIVKEIRKN